MKKSMALILSVAMSISVFAGCGSKPKGDADNKPAGTEAQSDIPEYLNAEGYPIVKEKITYKAVGMKSAAQGEWADMEVLKTMEKITNIGFQFETPLSTGYTEKKNLLLASGDVPDLFIGGALTVTDEETYGSQGLFIPLEKYIDRYAPSLKKLLESDPSIKRAITASDGHIYALPYVVRTKTAAPSLLYINMKWLENTGVKKPETVDDLYNVLKAFKEKDPNKNGQADEIALSDFKRPSLLNSAFSSTIMNAFSGQAGGANFDIKDGKVIYTPIQSYYKEYLTYMRKLYSEGLLDKEVFTQTQQQLVAKGKEGKLGILTVTPSSILNVDKYDPHEVIPPLTSSINSKKVTAELPGIVTGTFAITNKCQNPEALMRWVDILYKDVDEAVEGISGMAMFLGEYKNHWDFTDAGKTKYKRESKDPQMSPVEYTTKLVTPGAAASFPAKVITDAIPDGDVFLALKATESEKNYFPFMIPVYPGTVRYSKAESDRAAFLQNDINTYSEQMMAKFIVGEEPLDKWDSYVDTLKNKMNIEELTKIKQDAYDRWAKTK